MVKMNVNKVQSHLEKKKKNEQKMAGTSKADEAKIQNSVGKQASGRRKINIRVWSTNQTSNNW